MKGSIAKVELRKKALRMKFDVQTKHPTNPAVVKNFETKFYVDTRSLQNKWSWKSSFLGPVFLSFCYINSSLAITALFESNLKRINTEVKKQKWNGVKFPGSRLYFENFDLSLEKWCLNMLSKFEGSVSNFRGDQG